MIDFLIGFLIAFLILSIALSIMDYFESKCLECRTGMECDCSDCPYNDCCVQGWQKMRWRKKIE